MRTPAETKAFLCVPGQFNLWIDHAGWYALVLCSVENHHSAICTHSRNDVGILWLISRLVDLSLVIDLLYDVELDFNVISSALASSIATYLTSLFIKVFDIRVCRIWQLDMRNLQVVVGIPRSVCPYE